MTIQTPASHRQIAEGTRALIHSFLSLLGAEAHVSLVYFKRGDTPHYVFQLQAPVEHLPRLTGSEGRTWLVLRVLVRLIGAHHRLSFELGLADPPRSTWMAGVQAEVLRVPVRVEPQNPERTENRA